MGRKIDMKKIEDVTKCQVTFSKRRSSLMKKANEIAICCDVDIAFVAFSPSGRVSKFCNKTRIEDLLHRYVNLPAESRLNHLDDVQRKLEKLKNLDHIKSETSKLQYLGKQIENLELQIKKSGLELQILEANLRDFELDQEQEPSLHLLSWCERNISHSLEKVLARKSALLGRSQTSNVQPSFQNQESVQYSSNLVENEINLPPSQSSTAGQILNKVDPWISPLSTKFRESLLEDVLDQANPVPNISILPISSNTCDSSHSRIIHKSGTMVESNLQNPSSFQFVQQQPLVVDNNNTLLNFPQQDVNAWNNFSPATFSNSLYNSTQSLTTMPTPRSKSTTMVTSYGSKLKMASSSQYAAGEFTNKGEQATQVHMLDNSKQEGTSGDNTWTTSKIQKSNLWEWEDLLLDENFNFGFPK